VVVTTDSIAVLFVDTLAVPLCTYMFSLLWGFPCTVYLGFTILCRSQYMFLRFAAVFVLCWSLGRSTGTYPFAFLSLVWSSLYIRRFVALSVRFQVTLRCHAAIVTNGQVLASPTLVVSLFVVPSICCLDYLSLLRPEHLWLSPQTAHSRILILTVGRSRYLFTVMGVSVYRLLGFEASVSFPVHVPWICCRFWTLLVVG
jgi:hypothetical protein